MVDKQEERVVRDMVFPLATKHQREATILVSPCEELASYQLVEAKHSRSGLRLSFTKIRFR